ncbi:YfiR family protein [Alkalitalea saponilacus]|uniref:YfiR family protein n=1 Tax=Alkalitalea saponilacus TaxID=889453 RepID=A0A1T5A1K8_9BACT|nr:YfiR family protein [Alkalitalea saponilacus]ASB48929.1 hypothetical protein CDL62_07160 [Alkalitalea saponilacus]SKB28523.1 protein of unknown function [Alkalitalea saponilacus]
MKNLSLFIILLALPMQWLSAQDANLKAFYTLNLIRYVGWNEGALDGDFVISVVGNKEVADQLRIHSAGKRFGHQYYVIRECDKVEDVNFGQVVFIGKDISLSTNSRQLLEKARNLGVLIITESEGMINQGAAVNFVTREEGLRFELNARNAGYANLQFSSRLEAMSAAINLQ